MQPVETDSGKERAVTPLVWPLQQLSHGELAVNGVRKSDQAPPPVISAPPEQELERKLKNNPDDADAKADVGSDESMDASDPSAAVQPGCSDEPAPSSGFPDKSTE